MKKVVPKNAVLIPDQATCVFKGVIFDVYQWPQPEFDGTVKTYEMIKRNDTVCCIGVIDDQLLVIAEEQPHSGKRFTFPTGKVEASDGSLFTAVEREILEETGYTFKNWRLVQVVQPHSKIEWFVHYFVASEGIETAKPHLEAGERIVIKKLPLEGVKQLSIDKVDHFDEVEDIFREVHSIDELLALPEFVGREVDR